MNANETTESNSDSEKLWTRSFFSITLVNFLLFTGFQLFPSALPLYVNDLGGSADILGWVTGITTISALFVRPFSGALLDRFGRRIILLLGIVAMALVSVSYIFFPLIGVILVIRFIHGIGWGIASTATSTVASDVVPKKRFGEGIGYFSLSGSIALAIAPAISISLFYWVGMNTISLIAASILVIALLVAISLKCYQPGVKSDSKERTKLFEKGAILPGTVVFFVTATYGAIVTFIAIHGAEKGIDSIGLFFTVFALALLVSRPAFGKLVDTKGISYAVIPGLALIFVAMIMLSLAETLAFFLICAALYGVGYGAAQSGLQTLAVRGAPIERRGIANATFFVGFDAGIGFGSILSGFIAGAVGYSSLFFIYALAPIIGTVLYIWAYRRYKKKS